MVCANVKSWATGVEAGLLLKGGSVVMAQETRLRGGAAHAARAEARKNGLQGGWTDAKRIGPFGPAPGGLATLVTSDRPFRIVELEAQGAHWKESSWSHLAVLAGGACIHVINVYGWPQGSHDHHARQHSMWMELFAYLAGLGNAPWVAAGDWNAVPDEPWPMALGPRTAGFLPGGRKPTCFPVQGEPTENYLFVVGRTLREAVRAYDWLPQGVLPTQKAVRLTLSLEGLRQPVRSLRCPKAIPIPPRAAQGEAQAKFGDPWGQPMLFLGDGRRYPPGRVAPSLPGTSNLQGKASGRHRAPRTLRRARGYRHRLPWGR
jgi:hypothetical protein